jgi:tRNA(Ile)-lysidine synthase
MLYIKYHAKALLTGHHGDDQTETILMRILRGTSLKGLIGIQDDTTHNSMRLLRPLLGCSKNEILSYLEENKLEYRVDASNAKNDFTRNYLRNEVLPKIEKEFNNPHIKFQSLSRSIEEVSNFIDEFELEYYFKHCEIKINWDYYIELHPFMQKEILRRALRDLYKEEISTINNNHIEDLVRVLAMDKKEYSYNLPNKMVMTKFLSTITISKVREEKSYCLDFEDRAVIGGIHHFEISGEVTTDCIILDPKEVVFPLRIRTRKAGDRMVPKGMTGHKKLGSIFIEANISRQDRSVYPILVDANDKILWIPQIKMSKYCKIMREKDDIVIKYKRIDFK